MARIDCGRRGRGPGGTLLDGLVVEALDEGFEATPLAAILGRADTRNGMNTGCEDAAFHWTHRLAKSSKVGILLMTSEEPCVYFNFS